MLESFVVWEGRFFSTFQRDRAVYGAQGPSPNVYGPPVWKKSQIGDAESDADTKIREQY